KSNLFADLVDRIVIEFGELPIVEDTEVVELLLDRTGNAGKLLEVVGGAARTCQTLEARGFRRGRDFLARRLDGGADIDAGVALCPRNAIDCRAGDQVAIQRNGATARAPAGHDRGDAPGI